MKSLDMTRVVTASGTDMTSTDLIARTLHAFIHFAAEDCGFESVVMDISCKPGPFSTEDVRGLTLSARHC